MKLEPFVDGLSFGEGPRWRDGKLWYSTRNPMKTARDAGQCRDDVPAVQACDPGHDRPIKRYITGQVLVIDGGVTLQGPERDSQAQ